MAAGFCRPTVHRGRMRVIGELVEPGGRLVRELVEPGHTTRLTALTGSRAGLCSTTVTAAATVAVAPLVGFGGVAFVAP